MRKWLTLLAVVHAAIFAILWKVNPEISVLPLGGLVGISACSILYIIDRWGHNDIDTYAFMRESAWVNYAHIALYAVLILSGYVLAWIALR
jgi:hypothetical protein